MISEEGRAFALSLFKTHSLFLRNEDICKREHFDTNGKKEDLLTKAQLNLMLLVWTLGKATITHMECIVRISKGSLSVTVNRLVKDGYLKKKNDKNDKRVVFFSLTAKGIRVMSETIEKITEDIDNFYSKLTEEDQDTLKAGVDCFYKILKSQMEEDNNEK